jgi:glutamate-ammonia-ligase adenylyltransferase
MSPRKTTAAHPPAEGGPLHSRLTRAPVLADEKRARARLTDLAEPSGALAGHLAANDGLARLLAGLADHSPFLWRLASADASRLLRLIEAEPEARVQDIFARLRADAAATDDEADLMRILRVARQEIALLVALADLGGAWALEPVVGTLSAFADLAVSLAVERILLDQDELGKLALADRADPGAGSGFVVIAMGKHGARELNYSSDIDLVLLHDPERAPLADGVEADPLFTRVAQKLTRILQSATPDGYVFRVDLRLRPDPGSTPPSVPVQAALSYYESVGQNWERAAYIKARPVAGDIPMGGEFLAAMVPFIWRKHLDFAAISDIRGLKREIHALRETDGGPVDGRNVKLGPGGIREIEFAAQTMQLVWGGRRPHLRGPATLPMLAALAADDIMPPASATTLDAAYRFLREVEHRLQMVADEQTQVLPKAKGEIERFSRWCGFRDGAAFARELARVTDAVRRAAAPAFGEGEPAVEGAACALPSAGAVPEPAFYAGLGFREPEHAARTVAVWLGGERPALVRPRAREALAALAPRLIQTLGATRDPDGALSTLDRAFERMPAAVELFIMLSESAPLRRLFGDLLGEAPRLAEIVTRKPHVLDILLDPGTLTDRTSYAGLAALFENAAHGQPFEEALDRLRDLGQEQGFLVGARLLAGTLAGEEVGLAYSAVAEGAVRGALAAARASFEADHGVVPGSGLVVLGMGKLGSREMTATSDLDLIVVYDLPEKAEGSDGRRPLDPTVYFARLTQRLVTALTVPTRRGRLYDIDMRLRPSGGKGPVAVPFSGFTGYQRAEAETWEHMALTRARVIAGDEALAARVGQAILDVVAFRRDRERLAADIREMRDLIAREKGDRDVSDIKLVRGGLVDIEFVAQFLALAHAHQVRSIAARSTAAAIETAAMLGCLAPEDAERLLAAHRLFSDVQHWERLLQSETKPVRWNSGAARARIAARIGCKDDRDLVQRVEAARREVIEIAGRVIAADEGDPAEAGHSGRREALERGAAP